MKFWLYRISVVPTEGMIQFDDTNKDQLIEQLIKSHPEISYRNKPYRFTNVEQDEGAVVGRISRPDLVPISEIDPATGDLIDQDVPSHSWTHFIYVEKDQLIAVAQSSEFFSGTPDGLAKIVTALLTNALNDPAWTVIVRPVTDDADFWDVVKDSEGIRSVTFELVTPNPLGGAQELRSALEECRRIYNATKKKENIENEHDQLKLPQDNKDLQDRVSWVAAGKGLWRIVRRKGGQLTRLSSSGAQKLIDVVFDDPRVTSLKPHVQRLITVFRDKVK
jgi:hypothetical protein